MSRGMLEKQRNAIAPTSRTGGAKLDSRLRGKDTIYSPPPLSALAHGYSMKTPAGLA